MAHGIEFGPAEDTRGARPTVQDGAGAQLDRRGDPMHARIAARVRRPLRRCGGCLEFDVLLNGVLADLRCTDEHVLGAAGQPDVISAIVSRFACRILSSANRISA